jgi:hypothetical protein
VYTNAATHLIQACIFARTVPHPTVMKNAATRRDFDLHNFWILNACL